MPMRRKEWNHEFAHVRANNKLILRENILNCNCMYEKFNQIIKSFDAISFNKIINFLSVVESFKQYFIYTLQHFQNLKLLAKKWAPIISPPFKKLNIFFNMAVFWRSFYKFKWNPMAKHIVAHIMYPLSICVKKYGRQIGHQICNPPAISWPVCYIENILKWRKI